MDSSKQIAVSFLAIAIVHLSVSLVLVFALRKTKRIPFASKFLASGLITFDTCYIVGSTLRKFVHNPLLNTQINILCFIFLQLSYSTMAMMALDRMVVLARPMEYIRIVTEELTRRIVYLVWACVMISFTLVRYLGCWAVYKSSAVFEDPGTCNMVVTFYYIALVIIVQTASFISYIVVLNIVRKQTLQDNLKVSFKSLKIILRTYKSTTMVLIYIIVMTITSLAYGIVITLIRVKVVTPDDIRISIDIISIFNSFLDPFLYVLWYQECRFECKRMVVRLFSLHRADYPRPLPRDSDIFYIRHS